MPQSLDEYADALYELMRKAGMFYHLRYRIAPAARCHANVGGISFLRGEPVNNHACVSGIGQYRTADTDDPSALSCVEMFQLQEEGLTDFWKNTVEQALWRSEPIGGQTEFLRTKPPFQHGYWQSMRDADLTIMRLKNAGQDQFYLVKEDGKGWRHSQIPVWMIEMMGIRPFSNACLADCGTLPKSVYIEDGPIVHLKIEYLYPDAEQTFVNLYSWPENYFTRSAFSRVFSADVFGAVKNVLEHQGYSFTKG